MKFIEMHELFDLELDKHDAPYFNPKEIDLLLNLGQDDFIRERYRDFEKDQKKRDDLRTLIKTTSLPAGASVTLPTDYRYLLSVLVTISGKKVNTRLVQIDDLNKILNDPFQKPTDDFPLVLLEGNSLIIKSDTAPIITEIKYLKIPIKINGDTNPNGISDLAEHTHSEVVDFAVKRALLQIEDNRYQPQMIQTKENVISIPQN